MRREIVLGQGRFEEIEWQLVLLPEPMPPMGRGRIRLRSGRCAMGTSLPEKPPADLGGVGWGHFGTDEDPRSVFVYGEIHDRFDGVAIKCANGAEVDAVLVNCNETLGFNMYVGNAPEEPVNVVATTTSGERVTRDLRRR